MRMCLSVGVNVDVSEGVYGREFERVSKKLLFGDTLLLLSSYLEKRDFFTNVSVDLDLGSIL